MQTLPLTTVIQLHRQIIETTGGIQGIRDQGILESALAQPLLTFDGCDLYPSPIEKAAALGFSLIQNHPFLDGNKCIGHAAMEVLLMLHGLEIDAAVDEQEACILGVAAGTIGRPELTEWVRAHVCPYSQEHG
jgi:death on curing protein